MSKKLTKRTSGAQRTGVTLEQFSSRVCAGLYDKRTIQLAEQFEPKLRGTTSPYKVADALKLRCLVCEVLDYRGQYPAAQNVVKETSEKILAGWESNRVETGVRLLGLEVQVVLRYADCLYRDNRWDEAEKLLDLCGHIIQDHLEKKLLEDPSPVDRDARRMAIENCLIRLTFSRGRLARQNSQFDEAERLYGECIKHTFAHVEAAKRRYAALKDADRLATEHAYARHVVATVLTMGLAWMYVSKGQVKVARLLVMSGKVLFESTDDPLRGAFAEMILGALDRSEAVKSSPLLEDAIRSLSAAHKTFTDMHHSRHRAIAAFYLATAYFLQRDWPNARIFANQVSEGRKGDTRWEVNAKIVLSRIERESGNTAKAKSYAAEASLIADRGPHKERQVDALVALGEAEFAGGERDDARKSFLKALERCGEMSNPKWSAACHLHLANSYVDEQNLLKAQEHLARWRELEPQIQNGYLRDYAKRLTAQVDELDGDFHISREAPVPELDYHRCVHELQRFLYRQAMRIAGGDKQKAAEVLGVSRQSIYQWIDPVKYKKNSAADGGNS